MSQGQGPKGRGKGRVRVRVRIRVRVKVRVSGKAGQSNLAPAHCASAKSSPHKGQNPAATKPRGAGGVRWSRVRVWVKATLEGNVGMKGRLWLGSELASESGTRLGSRLGSAVKAGQSHLAPAHCASAKSSPHKGQNPAALRRWSISQAECSCVVVCVCVCVCVCLCVSVCV